MAVIEINKNPGRRELLWFGALLALFFGVVGAVVWHKLEAPSAAVWLWVGGGSLAALYFAVPPLRRFVYLGWIYAAFPIGWTVSHLALAAVYYLALTPVGLLMRLFGHDPMRRRWEPEAETYWEKRAEVKETDRYFRQF